jgi:hypothetical protein
LRQQQTINNLNLLRRNLILMFVGSLLLVSSIIIFSDEAKRLVIGDIFVASSATLQMILSLTVVYRQKLDGLIGKAYVFLAIGLVLWCIAEILWTYSEIVLEIKDRFPSISDIFWLAGYGPLIYYTSKMYQLFNNRVPKSSVILVCIASTIYLGFIIYFLVQHSEFSTQKEIPIFLISISYLIFDLILIVPTTLIILDPLKGDLTSIPWIFLSMLILAIADSMFGYTSVTGMTEANWIWTPVYTAAYLLMTIGLFWHNRFFVFDEKRGLKNWQKKNR